MYFLTLIAKKNNDDDNESIEKQIYVYNSSWEAKDAEIKMLQKYYNYDYFKCYIIDENGRVLWSL